MDLETVQTNEFSIRRQQQEFGLGYPVLLVNIAASLPTHVTPNSKWSVLPKFLGCRRRQLHYHASSHRFSFFSFIRRRDRVVTMSFARAFLRTSRALRSQNGSPIQYALSNRGQAQFAGAARNYATVFERNKPHVNIGSHPLNQSLRSTTY